MHYQARHTTPRPRSKHVNTRASAPRFRSARDHLQEARARVLVVTSAWRSSCTESACFGEVFRRDLSCSDEGIRWLQEGTCLKHRKIGLPVFHTDKRTKLI